jgi:hypothetical protein
MCRISMGTLMPKHDHFMRRNIHRGLDYLQHVGISYQTRRQHRDKVRTGQDGYHEQEVWYGKNHLALQSDFGKRIISHSMEAAAIW